jgi:hypothetical protein
MRLRSYLRSEASTDYTEEFFTQRRKGRRKGAKRYRVSKGLSLRLCAFAGEYFLFSDVHRCIGVLFVQSWLNLTHR